MRPRQLTRAAVVGGLYAGLSLLGSTFGISYGPIQFRFAEALTVLPFLFPETAWGLGIGCFVGNLLSPYGLLDMAVGTAATLLAALLTRKCPTKFLAPLPPVVCNGVLIGAVLAFEEVGLTEKFWKAFWFNACSVAISEAVVCFGLGLLLLKALEKRGMK